MFPFVSPPGRGVSRERPFLSGMQLSGDPARPGSARPVRSLPEAGAAGEAVPELGDTGPSMLGPHLMPAECVAGGALGGWARETALVADGVECLGGGHVV